MDKRTYYYPMRFTKKIRKNWSRGSLMKPRVSILLAICLNLSLVITHGHAELLNFLPLSAVPTDVAVHSETA
jgi:hypothetical protein